MWTTSRGIDKECIVSTASRDATPAPVPAPKLALRVELLPWERWLPLSNCTPALASRSATSSPSDVRGSSSSGVKPFRPPLMCSLALGDILHKAGILVSTLDGACCHRCVRAPSQRLRCKLTLSPEHTRTAQLQPGQIGHIHSVKGAAGTPDQAGLMDLTLPHQGGLRSGRRLGIPLWAAVRTPLGTPLAGEGTLPGLPAQWSGTAAN